MSGPGFGDAAGTPLPAQPPRTFGLPPRRGFFAGAALLLCCGVAAWNPASVLHWFDAAFALPAGTALVLGAWSHWSRKRRIAKAVARSADAPWTARALWNSAGDVLPGPRASGAGREAARVGSGVLALVVIAAVPDPVWKGAVLAIWLVMHAHLRPRNRVAAAVEFTRFPYVTGEPAAFRVRLVPTATAGTVLVTLRCLTETPRLAGLVWPEVRCVASMAGQVSGGGGRFDVAFDVPADAPGTDLLARPAVVWELLIQAESGGSRCEQAFQVPVYAARR